MHFKNNCCCIPLWWWDKLFCKSWLITVVACLSVLWSFFVMPFANSRQELEVSLLSMNNFMYVSGSIFSLSGQILILEFFLHAHQQGRVLHVIDGEGTKKGDWKRERERYREMSKTPTPKALSSCWPYNRFQESSSRRDLTRASTAWRVSNSPAYLAWETIDRPCWRCLNDPSERCRLVRKRRRKRWRQDIAGCQRGSTVFWKRP